MYLACHLGSLRLPCGDFKNSEIVVSMSVRCKSSLTNSCVGVSRLK
jgi:hypothetical protein